MLIWTNYVVAERGSVTDAECDKYCHCRNCQTNITHKHTHTNTHVHYDICICTITHRQKHSHFHTSANVRVLETCIHEPQRCWQRPPRPSLNQHTGFNNEVQISLFADTFSAFLPLSFVLLVKNAHKPDREIKRENILSFF